jgi:hypothetical protein
LAALILSSARSRRQRTGPASSYRPPTLTECGAW